MPVQTPQRRSARSRVNDMLLAEYRREWTADTLAKYCAELQRAGPGDMPFDLFLAYIRTYVDNDKRPTPEQIGHSIGWLIVDRNHLLIAKIATWYLAKANKRGLDMNDLLTFGRIGAHRAVEKFDAERGTTYSTYATWWIRQGILRGIETDGIKDPQHLPVYRTEQIAHLRRISVDLEIKLSRVPSGEEIVEAVIRDHGSVLANHPLTRAEIQVVLELTRRQTLSLDAPLDDDSETSRHTLLRDTNTPVPEAYALLRDTKEELLQLVKAMYASIERNAQGDEARNVDIFRERMGFGFDPIPTLEFLGERYCVSRERVRQIESACLRCIKTRFRLTREQVREIASRLRQIDEYFAALGPIQPTPITDRQAS